MIRALPGGARTASAGGKQVCVWEQGALVWKADADRYEVDAVLAHSRGSVISAGTYGTVSVFDGETGAVCHRFELGEAASDLFELPDGRVAVGLDEYEDLRLLDVHTGAVTELAAQGEQGSALDLRVDGDRLETIGPVNGVCRWDLARGVFERRVLGPAGEAVGFAGKGRAATLEEAALSIWSTDDGALIDRVEGLTELRGATISPDGTQIAVRMQAGIAFIDVASGTIARTLAYGPFPRIAAFSPDGARLAVVSTKQQRSSVTLFDVVTGKDVGGWDGEQVSTVTFVPGWLLLGKESGAIERRAL